MSDFRELKFGCQCKPQCTRIITTRKELESIDEKQRHADSDSDESEKNYQSIHCFRCLRKIKDENDDDDFFLCISCKRKAPTCTCGSMGVEPLASRMWGSKCLSCQ